MRTLILQHTEEENPGTLTEWLEQRQFPYTVHKTFLSDQIPSAENFEFLVVLGGPMNVDEEEKHPWLRIEKNYVKNFLNQDKFYLGICLGSQILAQALGAKVSKNTKREIGFFAVNRTENTHRSLANWPQALQVFHWHEDVFELPEGTKPLLTSSITPNQAFAWNEKTIGVQFHPESTENWIKGNFQDFTPEVNEPFVQNKEQCLPLVPFHLEPMKKQFFQFLDDFTKRS